METSHSLSAATGKVCLQRSNVVIIGSVFRGSSTCHFELLGRVRELEGGVGVGSVGEQGALPLQHVCHALQQLQEAEGQRCFSQTIQLLQRHKTPVKATPSLDIKRGFPVSVFKGDVTVQLLETAQLLVDRKSGLKIITVVFP